MTFIVRHMDFFFTGTTLTLNPGSATAIGCRVPGMDAASSEPADYDSAGCLRELNDFAAKHNSRLRRAVADLQASYPEVRLRRGGGVRR